MKIIKADYILTCDEKFNIIENGAIVFDEYIIDIGLSHEMVAKYPNLEIIDEGKNSVLMPGLINSHVHLEFSSNSTSLQYGDFMSWLYSVIEYREELSQQCTSEVINSAIEGMKKSGTTTFGEISSFGVDLQSCINTDLRVVYFNEVIGSNPSSVDFMYDDFKKRFDESMKSKSKTFIPAVSIHSSYSTHPFLIKKVLGLAKEKNLLVSSHFLESKDEFDWLENGDGRFEKFLKNFNPQIKPMVNIEQFINLFSDVRANYVHGCYAPLKYLTNNFIVHCPVSNRLLGNKKLDISSVCDDRLLLGTDGLSSNFSLSLWDEMRFALGVHDSMDLHLLAQKLILSATSNPANFIGLKTGVLKRENLSDFITITLEDNVSPSEIALMLILHTQSVTSSFIGGERIIKKEL